MEVNTADENDVNVLNTGEDKSTEKITLEENLNKISSQQISRNDENGTLGSVNTETIPNVIIHKAALGDSQNSNNVTEKSSGTNLVVEKLQNQDDRNAPIISNIISENVEENSILSNDPDGNKNSKKKKRIKEVESDSEDSDTNNMDVQENDTTGDPRILDEEDETSENQTSKNTFKIKRTIIYSDDEDENTDAVSGNVSEHEAEKNDDIEMEEVTVHNKSFTSKVDNTSDRTTQVSKFSALCDSDSEVSDAHSDLEIDKTRPNQQSLKSLEDQPRKISNLSALCDPDSDVSDVNSDREINDPKPHYDSEDEAIKPKVYKKKQSKKKDLEDQPKKMTTKQAMEQRKEIKSESQRLVRELNIGLPYHRPKSHTLKEFLSRRPKLASAVQLDKKASPSVAIKMLNEQLDTFSIKLKERQEKLKEFYKPESDSEDSEDQDYVPPTEVSEDTSQENSDTKTNQNSREIDSIIQTEPSEKNLQEIENVVDETNINETEQSKIEEIGSLELRKTVQGTAIKSDESNAESGMIKDSNEEECCDNDIHEKNSVEFSNNVVSDSEEQLNAANSKDVIEEENNVQSNSIGLSNDCKSTEPESTKELVETSSNSKNNIENVSSDVESSNKSSESEIGKHLTVSNLKDIIENVNANMERSNENILVMEPESYDFNLDDLDDEVNKGDSFNRKTENATVNETLTSNSEHDQDFLSNSSDCESKAKNKDSLMFVCTDLDKEIEEFEIEDDKQKKKMSRLEELKKKLANIKPHLSGGPNDVIELDTGIIKPEEVTKLMQRFAQHTAKKQTHKSSLKLNIVTVESCGDIHEETVAMKADDDEIDMSVEEKPGIRLQKLREELQNHITQKRTELWQQKSGKGIKPFQPEEDVADGKEADPYDDLLDDENEEELTDDDNSEEEEMEVDLEEPEKPRKKSKFVEDEAEEEDEEDNEDQILDNNDEEDEDIINENEEELEDSESDVDNNSENEDEESNNISPAKKGLRRIVLMDDDSDDENDTSFANLSPSEDTNSVVKVTAREKTEDDEITPHQREIMKTPAKDTQFLTPVSYITGLHNLNSASKRNSPNVQHQSIHNEPSPLKDSNWSSDLQKKLFTDALPNTQELEELCKGSLSFTQENQSDQNIVDSGLGRSEQHNTDTINKSCAKEDEPNTQDLMDLCSGKFTGVTQEPSESLTRDENRMNMMEVLDTESTSEVKCLDEEHGLIISQLIDEEEMENFKKKFDSPVISHTQQQLQSESNEAKEIVGGGVINSDDEDEENQTIINRKKRRQKKITFSDDEDSDQEEEKEEEEEIDLHDMEDEEEDRDLDDVAYDSEENEIVMDSNSATGAPKEKMRMADFFEAEAELSESEWGSEDEDEKGLDMLETEEGDKEKFDENKVRSELEKIHMRQVLDEDLREVKLLQEMLLEDGELHGTGRQRQFRWKNIDSVIDNNDENRPEDNEIYIDEEVNEEEWRKKRHEREMVLKEKLEKLQDEDNLLNYSQVLKLGQKFLQKSSSQNNSSNSTPTAKPEAENEVKLPVVSLNKRGSFLSRSDQVLERLAEYTKVSSTVAIGTAKNTKNFLFQTVSTETTNIEIKKRKAAELGTPDVIKKVRLGNLSPALKNQIGKSSRAKKLFNM